MTDVDGTLGYTPAEVLIPSEQIHKRIGELAAAIRAMFRGSAEPPIFVSVLKGSTLFLADLVRAADIDLVVDFMAISAYGASSSGVVRIVKDLDEDILGRDVLIVEDIVDTGLTLTYLRRTLGERSPRSVQAVTLLDKQARRIVPVDLELAGFVIPDVFVIGYGLDFQGRYRNLPHILAVRDLPRLANDPWLLTEPLFGRRDG